MLFRSVIAALALAGALAAPALGEEAAPLQTAEADAVFALRNVESLTFDPARAGLFAISDGRLMQWSLFPLELKAGVALDTLASDLAMSPNGTLLVAGQRWSRQSLLLLGGSVLAFPAGAGSGVEDPVRLYPLADEAAGISQFSSVAFDRSGTAYVASPVAFSVLVIPDDLSAPAAGIPRGSFDLRCGASAQFSVFEAGDDTFYFSSTIEGAALEFGALDLAADGKDGAECFRVANIYAQKAAPATFYSIRHAVISRPAADEGGEPWHGVLALEPNNGRLYLFEIGVSGGHLQIARSRSVEVDLSALEPPTRVAGTGIYGLLAASGDGSEIHVGGSSMRHVLRFSVSPDGRLVPRGVFDLTAPVQAMEISADGRYAAFVTGENRFGADRMLTILRNPAAVPEGAALPASFESVRLVQELLNAAGFDAGRVDGVYGPRTNEAIQAFIEAAAPVEEPVIVPAVPDQAPVPAIAPPVETGATRSLRVDDRLRSVIEGILPSKLME